MPRPRTKRMSQSLSQTGSELNTAITENGEEPFREVVKKKRFKQKAAELPDGRAQQVQSSEPALTGRLQAPAGAPVHNAGEENTVEGEPSAVQDSPLAESQSPETVVAGEQEEAAEAGAKELEGAAEELTLGGEQEDSADEMGEELSDSSLISDIPDSQPTSKKKLYTLEQVIGFVYRSSAPCLDRRLPPNPGNKLSCHLVQGILFPLHGALAGREGDRTPRIIQSLSQKETSNITERYTLIEELKTWTEAQEYCREHHTDLVSIKSASENEDLVKKAQVKPFWLGLFNEPWKWSRQGDNCTFHNLNTGQPDNVGGNGKCAAML
ncbi:UNVERIFIED_CONTAM: hypothetical protein FKN15_033281 [Acipenser sinensis]